MKQTRHNTDLIGQQIKESDKRIEELEAEINYKGATTANEKLKGELLQNEIKINNATFNEQIEIIKNNNTLIEETINKVKKEIDIGQIRCTRKRLFFKWPYFSSLM